MLVFPDMETFKATLAELERQTKELDDAFVEFYSDLDEEALNAKEEEIAFNEEKPLYDFENFLNFNSLHQQIAIEEEQWLSQEELDMGNDPDDHFVFEEELRSLLNADGEVQIGNSIYKLTEDGYFEITDGDLNSLAIIDNNNKNYNSLPKNIIFVGNENSFLKSDDDDNNDDCRSWKSKSSFKKKGDKRIKWKVKHSTWPWDRYASAKTTNYKKKKRGWKKYRAYTKTKVYGFISDKNADGSADCTKKLNFNPDNNYAVHNSKKSVKHKIIVLTKTKSGWIKGYHYGAGGISYTSTLTW